MPFVSSPRRRFAACAIAMACSASLAAGCRSAGEQRLAAAPVARALPVHHVIPLPASIDVMPGRWLTLGPASRIVLEGDHQDVSAVAALLAAELRPATAHAWPVTPAAATGARPAADPDIVLSLDPTVTGGREAYRLEVQPRGVSLRAATAEGLFRGAQTLRLLLPASIHAPTRQPGPWRLPLVSVSDAPRFAWRGAMLDVARHFFDATQVKRYIDLLALYKFNVLHLHLSDDQGWRIAIDAWPNLAAHGGSTSVNGDGGGYYTKADYADIVGYAAARFVTVIPEIDMPGHTNAALASYPELNCSDTAPELYTGIKVGFSSLCVGREITYRFVDDVVRELAAMTPGPYIHIGGDEVKTLSATEYATFIDRVQQIVARHGKQAIGWEEIGHATLAPTTVVQQWRAGRAETMAVAGAATASAARQGAKFVMSPASKAYLDMKYDAQTTLGLNWAGYVELRDAYEWDPAALFADVVESNILGVEAPLWTETIVTMRDLGTMVLPRLPAVAEVGWTGQAVRRWDSFRERIALHAFRWDAMAFAYYRSPQVEWLASGATRSAAPVAAPGGSRPR